MAKAKSKNSRKIGEVTFTKSACGLSKTAAQTEAKSIRNTNRMARVIANDEGTGFCVFKGPLSTTLAKRNAAAKKVSGVKKGKAKPKAKAKAKKK